MHNEFQSDIFLLLETIGALLTIIDSTNRKKFEILPAAYLGVDMNQKVILSIKLPKLEPKLFTFRSYKVRFLYIICFF